MSIIKFGAKGDAVVILQRQLIALGYKVSDGKAINPDGDFGAHTEHAVMQFQKKAGLIADGKVGDKTRTALLGGNTTKFLKDSDYTAAAKRLNVPELNIRAFGATEAQGIGFLKNGKAKILFERHKMYAYLVKFKSKAFANEQMRLYPNLVNTATGGYVGNEAEYTRLSLAKNIHAESALNACSWGQFQIMGENWQDLGYSSVFEFVEQMQTSETLQLEAFIRFIETKKGLLVALQKEDWDTVFRLYNGPNYKKLGYEAKFLKERAHLEPLYAIKQVA